MRRNSAEEALRVINSIQTDDWDAYKEALRGLSVEDLLCEYRYRYHEYEDYCNREDCVAWSQEAENKAWKIQNIAQQVIEESILMDDEPLCLYRYSYDDRKTRISGQVFATSIEDAFYLVRKKYESNTIIDVSRFHISPVCKVGNDTVHEDVVECLLPD